MFLCIEKSKAEWLNALLSFLMVMAFVVQKMPRRKQNSIINLLMVFLVGSCQAQNNVASTLHTEYQAIALYNEATYDRQNPETIHEYVAQPIVKDKKYQLLAMPSSKPRPVAPSSKEFSRDPSLLVGYQEPVVDKLLGKPTFSRMDGFSKIRQYHSNLCAIDVFLYDETTSGNNAVVEYVDWRAIEQDIDAGSCIRSVASGASLVLKELGKRQYRTASQ